MSTPPSPSSYHASDGAAFDRFLGRWTQRLAPLLVDFARLPDDGEMLDVGCGRRSLALEVARREPDRAVTGVDLSEPYLVFARTRGDALEASLLEVVSHPAPLLVPALPLQVASPDRAAAGHGPHEDGLAAQLADRLLATNPEHHQNNMERFPAGIGLGNQDGDQKSCLPPL